MIYVVDDNELNVELLVDLLEGEGYSVQGFTEPTIALKKVIESPPRLLLLDIVMPELDGITFCQQVKSTVTTFIPIIMLTAQNDTEIRHKGLDAGADDYITKPFNRLELLTRVRNFLRTKEMYDQIQEGLARTNQQMALAGQMQMSLFVPAKRVLAGFDYEQLYYPAKYLSGDVIHIHQDSTGQAFFFIADVAGHGVSSSLLAGAVKILVSEVVQTTVRPPEVLSGLNQELCKLLAANSEGYYVTAICALLGDNQLAISAAGHPPALLSLAGQVQPFGEAGLPLGIMANQEYKSVDVRTDNLDWLLLYTDGLTECVDLEKVARSQEMTELLRAAILLYAKNNGLTDDVAALVIRRAQ